MEMINIENNNSRIIYHDLYSGIGKRRNDNIENFTARMPRVNYQKLYSSIEKPIAKETANIWHQYPLKMLVYSNDVGESVRPVIGNTLALLSWILAISYTLLAVNSGNKRKNLGKELAFQGIASFLMPFLMLKSTRALTSKAIDKVPAAFKNSVKSKIAQLPGVDHLIGRFKKNNASGYKNVAMSAASIGALLVGVKPIDNAVRKMLDKHFA